MGSALLKGMIAAVKDSNTKIAADGESAAEFTGTVDTGSYALNALLSGSIFGGAPNNKITAFAGETSTGKTFFVMGIVKYFLDSNENGAVIYYDTEAAVTKHMMEQRGIDTTRVIIAEPDTVQKFRTHILGVLNYYESQGSKAPPLMIILDSLGMLSTSKEAEDSAEGKETRDMTRAQIVRATFRVLTLKLAKLKVPLFVTNHTYEVVGAYIPTKEMSSGGGLKFAASTIAFLSKKKDRDGDKNVVGNIIKVKLYKSRLSKENSEVEVRLSYQTGLDRHYGLLDLCEKYRIFKKLAKQWEMPDGTKVFEKGINANPEKYFTQPVLELIDQAARKEFLYGGIDGPTTDDDAEDQQ